MIELTEDALFIAGILFLNIALSEWLCRHTALKHFGTALLVILVTAVEANMGLIPSSDGTTEIYSIIFQYVAPIAIFYLLLECNIASIRNAGFPILLMFFIGSLGTVIGALISGYLLGGAEKIGEFYPQIAGMFTGTYTGGSINFNAVALEYDVNKEGNLYAGAVAIDNIWTALWMIATIVIPKTLYSLIPRDRIVQNEITTLSEKDKTDTEKSNPFFLSILIVIGIATYFISEYLADLGKEIGILIPSILILTTISLVLAQSKRIQSMTGSRLLGILGIYLFLAVIGAYCDFSTLPKMGALAYNLLIYVGLIVFFHGLFTFGAGYILKQDWDVVAIASQANVGGSGSALALARSLNRHDLLLPAILLGTVGNAVGTYLGFLVVAYYS